MMRGARLVALISVLAMSIPAASLGSSAAGASSGISTSEQRLTTAPNNQFDPSISGNIVSYTADNTDQGTGYDVYYRDLTTGQEHQITASPGNQMLSDVSGDRIVYSDMATNSVVVYDLTTGTTTDLTAGLSPRATSPVIDGSLVAWIDTRDGNYEIYAQDLATGEQRRITYDVTDRSINPSVNAGRIVWEQCPLDGSACDVYLYDWVTGVTTQVTNTPTVDERLPDVNGNTVVYQRTENGETDVAAYDLGSGTTKLLGTAGVVEQNPNVSGDFVSVEQGPSGAHRLVLWQLSTGWSWPLTTSTGSQTLNDIDGNRVVYTDDRAGQQDIYLTTFSVSPQASVTPDQYGFGEVALGASNSTLVSVQSTGAGILHVTGATVTQVTPSGVSAFSLTPAPALPVALKPGTGGAGQTLDLPVKFAPTTIGTYTGSLTITTDDPDHPSIVVPLTGTGVSKEVPPIVQVQNLLTFIDTSTANGTVSGVGPGSSATNKLKAFRNMIADSSDLILQGKTALACDQLASAYAKTDGDPKPPDFVAGTSAAEVAAQIVTLRTSLGC
jgi:beta propeller repeat protein